MSGLTVNFDDVKAAYQRLEGVANRTPIMTSRKLSELAGVEVYLKCENFQRVGAFKFRGAYNCISNKIENNPELKQQGIMAISSGNHSQGVALAAKLLGVPCTIYIPSDAPANKIDATRNYGAKVELFDRYKDDRDELYANLINGGQVLIHGFDDPYTIAGQGTACLELMQEVSDLDAIMTPLGGGGLLAGSAIVAKELNPAMKVFGVEPEVANDWKLSIEVGKRVKIEAPKTIADGVSICAPGELNFAVLKDLLDDVILISEEEIMDALGFVIHRLKLVIEPSSALPIAALLEKRLPLDGIKKIGIIISGGNIDTTVLQAL